MDPNHYKPFSAVYGQQTSESYRPSMTTSSGHGIPFPPSAQTTQTVGELVRCKECEFPQVINAARKLTWQEKEQLKAALSDYWYTCGSSLQNLLLTITCA